MLSVDIILNISIQPKYSMFIFNLLGYEPVTLHIITSIFLLYVLLVSGAEV